MKDRDEATVLHYACVKGSRLITFLVEQAKRLGIIDILLFSQDIQGRTPLFRLCQQGYIKRGKCCTTKEEHKIRYEYVQLLVTNPKFDDDDVDAFDIMP